MIYFIALMVAVIMVMIPTALFGLAMIQYLSDMGKYPQVPSPQNTDADGKKLLGLSKNPLLLSYSRASDQ